MSDVADATALRISIPLISVRELQVSFGETEVLHGVDLDIAPGERVAIVGQSGSGKSTLAAAILRLLPRGGRITGGSIQLGDNDIATANEQTMLGVRGSRIGLVPQDPSSNLNPSMRVGAQIADALRAHGVRNRAEIARRVVELMTEAGIPDAARRTRQYPHEFSGGMRQRTLIAIALARRPQLLIADEPTSALDVTVQAKILDHLQTIVDDHGMSLLFITHDLGVAADRADRVIVMLDGRVVETGESREILRHPAHDYTRRLIDAVPVMNSTRTDHGAEPLSDSDGERSTAAPILVVDDVVMDYTLRGQRGHPIRAVDHMSFTVDRGTTTAIVGESGSGKSTLAKIVLGLERPTSGRVTIDGQACGERKALRTLRRRVQPVFQDPFGSLDPTYTVERLIDEPLRIFRTTHRAGRRERVAELLDQVALPRQMAQRRPGELSGGQRQRVAIARALALEPELIICDEAVSALDVLVQKQILELLRDLQHRLGLTYLFITHDLGVVRELAHRVVVMRQGVLLEEGPVDDVFHAPEHPYTRSLLDAVPGTAVSMRDAEWSHGR